MHPTSGGGGLGRFRSTPASWLEAVLLKEEGEGEGEGEGEDSLNLNDSNQCFTQLLSNSSNNSSGFFRQKQNTSPPDFLGNSLVSDSVFASDYHYASPHIHVSASASANANPITHTEEVEHSGKAPDMKMNKILEDSVPCRVRAKRGCATHPRSIAERVRRTRISDRIRKLQELVPNMDKQTNTADMLDEAVAYVKFLQKQIEELSENQRRCKCMVQE